MPVSTTWRNYFGVEPVELVAPRGSGWREFAAWHDDMVDALTFAVMGWNRKGFRMQTQRPHDIVERVITREEFDRVMALEDKVTIHESTGTRGSIRVLGKDGNWHPLPDDRMKGVEWRKLTEEQAKQLATATTNERQSWLAREDNKARRAKRKAQRRARKAGRR